MQIDYEASQIHHQAYEQQRAEQEAARQQWLARTRTAIREIAPRHIKRVNLFGSLMQPDRFRSTMESLGVRYRCGNRRAD